MAYNTKFSQATPATRPISPTFRALCVILYVMFLCACTVLGILLGQSRAKLDYASSISPESPSDQNENENDEKAVSLLTQNGIRYAPVSKFKNVTAKSAENHLELQTESGVKLSFCSETTDYFVDNKLCLLKHTPLVLDGEWYLPLEGISDAAISESKLLDTALPALSAPSENAPTLPADIDCAAYFSAVTEKPKFTLDLSEFEDYMAPADRDGYLVLANSENSLGADFVPQNLEAVERARYAEDIYKAKLQEPAAKALDAFLREAYAMGYNDITVTSGYRSYSDQENRFNTKVASLRSQYATLEEAQAAAATVIQWPGKSEHQTGLACDMHNLPAADVSFDQQPAAKWLRENAHNFGFILRYPADKTDVTGISFEPWHFRYVGRYHATRIFLLDLSFEEYMSFYSAQEANA